MKKLINWLKEEYILFTQFGPIQRKWLRFLKNNPERQGKGALGYIENNEEKVCCLGQFGLMTGICKWDNHRILNPEGDVSFPSRNDMLQYGFLSSTGTHTSFLETHCLAYINDHGTWLDVYNACLANPKGYFTKKV